MQVNRFVLSCAAAIVATVTTALPASAASVAKFAAAQAINWHGQVINVELVMPFYKRTFGKGIWTTNNGLSKRGAELVDVLSKAGADGLDTRDYLGGLKGDVNAMRGDDLAAAELYLSEAAIRFSRDLFAGRTTPSISEPDIVIARKQLDTVALLDSFDKNGVEKVMARLRPAHEQYTRLRQLLAKTSNEAQHRKIVVNMERWRWLPRDLGERHVLVNAAAFLMYTYDKGRMIDRRRVIVGQEYHRTPMFSSAISYAEFNPTWTVSRNIAGNEILPKLRKNPNYLSSIGYEVHTSWEEDSPMMNPASIDWSTVPAKNFPYRIVQPAGPENVLGVVKFLFPNKFNVYLHDTSSRQLFDKADRALSHGCIRIENPLEFADLLYGFDRSLAPGDIRGLVASKKTVQAKFRKPVPVHLGYFTLWVGDDGRVSNFDDIYGRDKLIERIVFGGA
ncbi:MAG: L,D-transpeptidase family protein [Nitratireductor sp.]|nr:L,D-transpeptidase family protein [Nitratireductor sp.]